jgi:hypothetical protein
MSGTADYPLPTKKSNYFIKTSYPKLDFLMALIYILFVVGVSFTMTSTTVEYMFTLMHTRDIFGLIMAFSALTGVFIGMIVVPMLGLVNAYANLAVFLGVVGVVMACMGYLNLEYYTNKYKSETSAGSKPLLRIEMTN